MGGIGQAAANANTLLLALQLFGRQFLRPRNPVAKILIARKEKSHTANGPLSGSLAFWILIGAPSPLCSQETGSARCDVLPGRNESVC
ncbi:MAG: hypothetical protein ACXWLT_02320, partial [Rhizomicrobium sp.]